MSRGTESERLVLAQIFFPRLILMKERSKAVQSRGWAQPRGLKALRMQKVLSATAPWVLCDKQSNAAWHRAWSGITHPRG